MGLATKLSFAALVLAAMPAKADPGFVNVVGGGGEFAMVDRSGNQSVTVEQQLARLDALCSSHSYADKLECRKAWKKINALKLRLDADRSSQS